MVPDCKAKAKEKMSGFWVCVNFYRFRFASCLFRSDCLCRMSWVPNKPYTVLWAACSEWAVCWNELCVQREQITLLTVPLSQARKAIRSALPEYHSPSELSWPLFVMRESCEYDQKEKRHPWLLHVEITLCQQEIILPYFHSRETQSDFEYTIVILHG